MRIDDQILVLGQVQFLHLRNQVIELDSIDRRIEREDRIPTHNKDSLASFVGGSAN